MTLVSSENLRAQFEVGALVPAAGLSVCVVFMEDGVNQRIGWEKFVNLLTVVGADLENIINLSVSSFH